MRATLRLIRFQNGNLGFQGDNDPCTAGHPATFSLYPLDGEDGGCPFCANLGVNEEWEVVPNSPVAHYEPSDGDSFWEARERLIGKLTGWVKVNERQALFFESGKVAKISDTTAEGEDSNLDDWGQLAKLFGFEADFYHGWSAAEGENECVQPVLARVRVGTLTSPTVNPVSPRREQDMRSKNAEYERVKAAAIAEYKRLRSAAGAEYERVMSPAIAEHERVMALADAEYERAQKAADAEYKRMKAADAEYNRLRSAADAEYNRVKAAADAEYERATAPADAAYEHKRARSAALSESE